MGEKEQVNKITDKLIKQSQQKELIKNVLDDMPFIIESVKAQAKIHMEKFKALKDEGFNDEQALELCKIIF